MTFAREANSSIEGPNRLTVTVEFRLTLEDMAGFLARWNRWSEDHQPNLAASEAKTIIEEELYWRGDAEWYGNEYFGEDEWDQRLDWAESQVKRLFGNRF